MISEIYLCLGNFSLTLVQIEFDVNNEQVLSPSYFLKKDIQMNDTKSLINEEYENSNNYEFTDMSKEIR